MRRTSCPRCSGTGWITTVQGKKRRCTGAGIANPASLVSSIKSPSGTFSDAPSPSLGQVYSSYRRNSSYSQERPVAGWWNCKETTLTAHEVVSSICAGILEKKGRVPAIAVDLDGTIADFNHGFRQHVARHRDIPAADAEMHLPDPTEYEYWGGENPWFTDHHEFTAHFHDFERKGGYRHLPVMDGAQQSLSLLSSHDIRLIAFTARSEKYNDDTLQWFKKHRLPIREIVNAGHRKEPRPYIDAFIDDSPIAIDSLSESGGKVIIFRQKYNRDKASNDETIASVETWRSIDFVHSLDKLLSVPRPA